MITWASFRTETVAPEYPSIPDHPVPATFLQYRHSYTYIYDRVRTKFSDPSKTAGFFAAFNKCG